MTRGGVAPKTGMTRAEAYAWVAELRAAGWTYAQIAGELCISKSYVRDLFYDPTGERVRERKRKRKQGGVCEACGDPTSYGKPGKGPARQCEPCQIAQARAGRYWTDKRCLEAAREWRRRFGDWPTAQEWLRASTIDGYRFPCTSTCYDGGPRTPGHSYGRPWLSWAAFLEAAGASRDEVGMTRTIRAGTAALARLAESRRARAGAVT